ncbi:MAG TPA: hypothetical protein VK206_22480 [Anaerolineales bacterium]|nr:hypothetical protein [Anaerolineales bacterium]
MIDYLIHFYRSGTEPFRSLSLLAEDDAIQIMQSLYVEGAVFWERFKDPAQYLRMRKQIEQNLRQAFLAKGGMPQQAYPIYMVLGWSKWLQADLDAATLATTAQIQVPLSLFRECDVSFTYPDSMVSFLLANQKESEYYLPDYHGKLFTLAEICQIIELNGLPGEKWGTNLPNFLPNYIEAQVWKQEALLEYKRQLFA